MHRAFNLLAYKGKPHLSIFHK